MEEISRQKHLTPRQLQTLDGLLAIGGSRPTCSDDLAERLELRLEELTRTTISRWTEKSLYLTKAQVITALRCEGQLTAPEEVRGDALSAPTMVGIVSHRAIQMSCTHPHYSVADYVRHGLVGSRGDERFDRSWLDAGPAQQSDMLMQVSSRVVNFIDDWPPLDAAWSPRFEEPLSARVGKLTLSSRVDLVMGRVRPDLRQTMLLCDLKSGNLRDEHELEASFYALVSTLRHRVAPWRSVVYSLASGEYTEPDVGEDRLFATVEAVAQAARSIVEVRTEAREPVFSPGDNCSFCPLRLTCPASALNEPLPEQLSQRQH